MVTDESNKRIELLNLAGSFIGEIGTIGNRSIGGGASLFQCPRQLCIQPGTHNVLVADYGNNCVQMFTENFQYLYAFGHQYLQYPNAVDSNISQQIVAVDRRNQAYLFTSDGQRLIRSFCKHGDFSSAADQTNEVWGICFDNHHNSLYICDYFNQKISIWSADGSTFIGNIKMPEYQYPCSVNVDRFYNNNRLMVGSYNAKVFVFDTRKESHVIQEIGGVGEKVGQFAGYVNGVVVDEYGTLWCTDYKNHRIQSF